MARCENGPQETVTDSSLLASKMLEFQSGQKHVWAQTRAQIGVERAYALLPIWEL